MSGSRPKGDRDVSRAESLQPDVGFLVSNLARQPEVLRALLTGIDGDRACAKGRDGGWSILEILGHLVDEEREDFPPRLFSTLEDPERAWNSIDPEGRVAERDWNRNGNVDELLWILMTERASALARLRVLPRPDWGRTSRHPSLGTLSAADLLVSWAAHDQLHVRQILRRLFELSQDSAGAGSTDYAGSW
ncbi:MAG: hypothetical protein ACI8QS_002876 [Planctomycetota bacterium]